MGLWARAFPPLGLSFLGQPTANAAPWPRGTERALYSSGSGFVLLCQGSLLLARGNWGAVPQFLPVPRNVELALFSPLPHLFRSPAESCHPVGNLHCSPLCLPLLERLQGEADPCTGLTEFSLGLVSSAPCTEPGAGPCSINICRMNSWRSSQGNREWCDRAVRMDMALSEHFPEQVELTQGFEG